MYAEECLLLWKAAANQSKNELTLANLSPVKKVIKPCAAIAQQLEPKDFNLTLTRALVDHFSMTEGCQDFRFLEKYIMLFQQLTLFIMIIPFQFESK